jgi:hypothetical protein
MAAAAASRVLVTVTILIAVSSVLGDGGGGNCFTRLFSFGDSITDNGNWMRYARSPGAVAWPPYGETFFHRPNGRFCDGRIIIDHIGTRAPPDTAALPSPYVTRLLARM